MPRCGNKENAPAAVAPAPLKGPPAASPAKARKRPVAEVDGDAGAEQLVGKAKVAIKRRCAEMGIRKYASLSSMASTHARTADRKDEAAEAHKRAGAAKAELSSEATVVVLSSDECDDDDEDEQAAAAAAADVLLESQLTVVAPSSPVRLLGRADALSDAASASGDEDDCEPAEISSPTAETYTELCDWLRGVERRHGLGLELGLARHPELSGRMRPILVDWLMEVAADYRMHRQTLHLAVQFLDRFLANTALQVRPSMLQCYGTACLSLAMKAEEQRAPSLTELTDFSKDAFSRDQLKQAEIDVLVALRWHLAVPTVYEFLCLTFQRAALLLPERFADPGAAGKCHPRQCAAMTPRRFDPRKFTAACDYADALLHFQGGLRHRASVLAAACFYLGTAPDSLGGPMFARCTGYAFSEVWPAVLQLKRLRTALDPAATASALLRPRPCCEPSTRYASHLKRIRPAELWAFQPHHTHLLDEFENHFASR
ncbi:G1/S-specific cyclin-E1 [Coemansia spiralis]|nr:G1/S-specific cyclin-E1 [Coemansia spiralis]